MEAAARLRDPQAEAPDSVFTSQELEELILKDKKAFLKTKCAECGGTCGLAKKYKETMSVIIKSMMDTFWCRDCGRVVCDAHRYTHTCEKLDALKERNAKITKEALLEQLRADEERKEAIEAAAKDEQRRAAEQLEQEKSQRKAKRKILATKAKQVENFIQQRSRDADGLRPGVHNQLLELYPRVRGLALALYNQFEHPDSTEVGGKDWDDVKEIYAQARRSA
ncbi:unnamed protein product [Symbiodinium natans]|uniref:Uncharacterized protein n=1 Tax=Symbiodinium natans TaxID=878477 RepID=A0A812JBR5_9DINO|nr:unnamed protein product [Symbiodinium natans]